MTNEVITQGQDGFTVNMGQNLQVSQSVNSGSVAVEQQRAIAEAQGQLILAKRFPRDLTGAHAELMSACKSIALAQVAFYALPRGKQTVSGPSIRLAEEIARVYGNFQYGHRELSRDDKKSEVEVYAWDMEKNNYSKRQLTVMHVMDTKEGPRKLRDQKDIDDKIANVASKQVRGRILALVPKWLVEDAIVECRRTLAGDNEIPVADRVRKMTQAFAKFGVGHKHLEGFLGHTLDDVTVEEIADLQGVYNAIKDGSQKISDFFGETDEKIVSTTTGAALAAAAEEGNQTRKPSAAKGTTRQTKKPDQQQIAAPDKEPPLVKGDTEQSPDPDLSNDTQVDILNDEPAMSADSAEELQLGHNAAQEDVF